MAASRSPYTVLTVSALIAGASTVESAAQISPDSDVSPNTSVSQRFFARRDLGDELRLGSFAILPTAKVDTTYVDNVFVDETEKRVDDLILETGGETEVLSQWSRHGLAIFGSYKRNKYTDNDSESFNDRGFGGRAWLDMGRASRLTVDGSFRKSVETRQTLQTADGAIAPVEFSESYVGATLDIVHTRFREEIGVRFEKSNFFDAVSAFDGSTIDQDFRDEKFASVYARQYVRVRPTIEMFVEARGWNRRFEEVTGQPFPSQDSRAYALSSGVAFDINKVARGEVLAGYQKEDFENDDFVDLSGFFLEAEMNMFVSDLTTVNVNAARAINPSGILGIGGFVQSTASVGVDHELTRKILLSGEIGYRLDELGDIDREDHVFTAGVEASYLIGKRIALKAGYGFTDVRSTGSAARSDFDQSAFRIGIELRR